MIFAQGPRPLVAIPQSSQPCAPNDEREICRLRAAVSASLDQIEDLKKKIKTADDAIKSLTIAADAAQQAIKANAAEREAHERTLAIAEKAIEQQQELIVTYQGAIKTLTDLVGLTMKRVEELERKLDKANGRTAVLGIILTAVSVIVSLKR